MRRTAATACVTVALFAVFACGHPADPTAAHQPGDASHAVANQPGGTCAEFTVDQIKGAFGGTVSAPSADNLTASLDRCSWTITDSRIAKGSLTLIAYRPMGGTPPAKPIYDARNHTLAFARSGKALSLQLVVPASTKVQDAKVRTGLTTLAR